jgi:hypothetical protein
LLNHPWLRDAKIYHDYGSNIITIQGIGTIKTIHVTKKWEISTKWIEMLVCYDFHSRTLDDKEDLMFDIKLELFWIQTIVVLKTPMLKKKFKKLLLHQHILGWLE